MSDNISVMIDSEDDDVPESSFLSSIVARACHSAGQADVEINVQIVNEAAMTDLNHQYRGKSSSTNVLSFEADLPTWVESKFVGDIVLCPAVIRREAAQYHKSLEQRWAHMLVHGVLHLLGMDHDQPAQQTEMESMEQTIMKKLGYDDPYQVTVS